MEEKNETTTAVETTATTAAPAANTASRAPRSTGSRSPRSGGPAGARGGFGGGNRRPGGQGGRPGQGGRFDRADRPKPEFDQKMIDIRRVTRVVAGGRRFSFSVTLIAGDKKGRIGVGVGKATDTTLAINKAFNDAKKNMIKVKMTDTGSIPHDIKAKYNSGRVFLMPNKSRGVVVGSSMRSVIELAGITDVTGRVISGTKNKLNIARATVKALSQFAVPAAVRATE